MKRRWWVLGAIVVAGVGLGAYMLKPVQGPARDLTLVGDVERGNYLIRWRLRRVPHQSPGRDRVPGRRVRAPDHVRHLRAAQHYLGPASGHRELDAGPVLGGHERRHGPEGTSIRSFLRKLHADERPGDRRSLCRADGDRAGGDARSREFDPVPLQYPPRHGRLEEPLLPSPALHAGRGQSELYNRGKYLAMGPAHCVACHSPRNALGALDWNAAFTGSTGGPGGKARRSLRRRWARRATMSPA